MSDVLYAVDGPIARVTLNRESAGNAMNQEVCDLLCEAAIRADTDDNVRAIVITGAGRMFCAGGDLAAFTTTDNMAKLLMELTATLHSAVARFARMQKPVVTMINGPAAGAGLSLAVSGDIAIAARSASFSIAYPGVGLSPDGGASFFIPRLVGMRRAQEMFLLNEKVTAETAAETGLVSRVVDDDKLVEETEKVLAKLVSMPTRALGRSRQLLAQSFDSSLETQLENEARAIAQSGREPDAKEGASAFAGRRKPVFTGKG